MTSIIYVGMDVHTTNYTLCCYSMEDDRYFAEVQVEPDVKNILKYLTRIEKQQNKECHIVCGYEAGCLGYSLYHQLHAHGVDCVILAPTTMMTTPGNDRPLAVAQITRIPASFIFLYHALIILPLLLLVQPLKKCSAHYIRAVVLEQLVLQNLQRVVAYAQDDEDEFVRRIMENKTALQRNEQEQAKRKLEKQERRINELDAIIQRLYEDRVVGTLSAERFAKLTEGYEKEQAELKQTVEELRKVVAAADSQTVNIKSFLKIVKKYTEPTELTPALLREFVEKVVVHAPDKSSGHRVQRIDVHYNFIGEIDFSPEFSRYSKKTTA